MNTVWAYREFNGTSELKKSKFELEIFKSSLVSWIKFAPSFRRIGYFDQGTHIFFSESGILQYFDEVQVVDFSKEVDLMYKSSLFSAPKMWAYTQQREPFFICDTDLVLHKPVRFWFDPEKYWGVTYDHSDVGKIAGNCKESDFLGLAADLDTRPFLHHFADFTKSVNGCLFYFKDPQVANLVGELLLTAGNFIKGSSPESWVLYEEAAIVSLVEFISKEKVNAIPLQSYSEYCNIEDLETQRSLKGQVKQILGLDFI